MSSCHIYKIRDADRHVAHKGVCRGPSTACRCAAFGNLLWLIFTDPQLATLINQALANNTNLRNAHSFNVEVSCQPQGCTPGLLHRSQSPPTVLKSFGRKRPQLELQYRLSLAGKSTYLRCSIANARPGFIHETGGIRPGRSQPDYFGCRNHILLDCSRPQPTSNSRAIPQPYGKKQCRQCATSRKPDVALPKQP